MHPNPNTSARNFVDQSSVIRSYVESRLDPAFRMTEYDTLPDFLG